MRPSDGRAHWQSGSEASEVFSFFAAAAGDGDRRRVRRRLVVPASSFFEPAADDERAGENERDQTRRRSCASSRRRSRAHHPLTCRNRDWPSRPSRRRSGCRTSSPCGTDRCNTVLVALAILHEREADGATTRGRRGHVGVGRGAAERGCRDGRDGSASLDGRDRKDGPRSGRRREHRADRDGIAELRVDELVRRALARLTRRAVDVVRADLPAERTVAEERSLGERAGERPSAPASAWAVKESWLIQPMTRFESFGLSKTTRKNVPRCAISVTLPPLASVATTLPMPGISRTFVWRWIVAATFSSFFSSGKRETSFSFVAAATAAAGGAASATSATAASASASAASPPFLGHPLTNGTSAARATEQETSLIPREKVVMTAGG